MRPSVIAQLLCLMLQAAAIQVTNEDINFEGEDSSIELKWKGGGSKSVDIDLYKWPEKDFVKSVYSNVSDSSQFIFGFSLHESGTFAFRVLDRESNDSDFSPSFSFSASKTKTTEGSSSSSTSRDANEVANDAFEEANGDKGLSDSRKIAIGVVISAVALLIVCGAFYFCRVRSKRKMKKQLEDVRDESGHYAVAQYLSGREAQVDSGTGQQPKEAGVKHAAEAGGNTIHEMESQAPISEMENTQRFELSGAPNGSGVVPSNTGSHGTGSFAPDDARKRGSKVLPYTQRIGM